METSIPVYAVITIDFEVRASGTFRLDYSYERERLQQNNSSISATITPQAWAQASGSGGIQPTPGTRWRRGRRHLLRTGIPMTLSAGFNGSAIRFCADIKIWTEPLSGRIYAYADVGIDLWIIKKWWRVFEGPLWSFNVGRFTGNILVRCW